MHSITLPLPCPHVALPCPSIALPLPFLPFRQVRTAGYTLANVHKDAAPTWRRGNEATQLDHILYRISGVQPATVTRTIEWLPSGVTDHALIIGTFRLPEPLPATAGTAATVAAAELSPLVPPPPPLVTPSAEAMDDATRVMPPPMPSAVRILRPPEALAQPADGPKRLTRLASLSLPGLPTLSFGAAASSATNNAADDGPGMLRRALTRTASYLPSLPFVGGAVGGAVAGPTVPATDASWAPLLGSSTVSDPRDLVRIGSTESTASVDSQRSAGAMSVQL